MHLAAWKLGVVSVPLSTLFGHDALTYRLENREATALVVDEETLDNIRTVTASVRSLETT